MIETNIFIGIKVKSTPANTKNKKTLNSINLWKEIIFFFSIISKENGFEGSINYEKTLSCNPLTIRGSPITKIYGWVDTITFRLEFFIMIFFTDVLITLYIQIRGSSLL